MGGGVGWWVIGGGNVKMSADLSLFSVFSFVSPFICPPSQAKKEQRKKRKWAKKNRKKNMYRKKKGVSRSCGHWVWGRN